MEARYIKSPGKCAYSRTFSEYSLRGYQFKLFSKLSKTRKERVADTGILRTLPLYSSLKRSNGNGRQTF